MGGSTTPADPALANHLSALQLSDSAFPSGRYTLSYGLETLVQSGHFTAGDSPSRLLAVVSDALRYGIGPSDGVATDCAHRALTGVSVDLELATITDRRLTAIKLAREPREASTRTGRALLHLAVAGLGVDALEAYAIQVNRGDAPGNHAVVFGLVSAALGVGRPEAVAGELYAFVTACTGAAVRLGLIDHQTAQVLVHRLLPVTVDVATSALDRDVGSISSSTPFLDIMAMRHEEAELRLFAI